MLIPVEGIGRAIATRFLREEAKVVLVARDSVRLKEVADLNPKNGNSKLSEISCIHTNYIFVHRYHYTM